MMQSLQQNEFNAKTAMEIGQSVTAPLESKSLINNKLLLKVVPLLLLL